MIDQIKEWLLANEFQICRNAGSSGKNLIDFYACKPIRDDSLPQCETNKYRHQIGIELHCYRKDAPISCGMIFRAEFQGVWYSLSSYGVKFDDLQKCMPGIEANLIAAWRGLAGRE